MYAASSIVNGRAVFNRPRACKVTMSCLDAPQPSVYQFSF